jgi:hypothetical protein
VAFLAGLPLPARAQAPSSPPASPSAVSAAPAPAAGRNFAELAGELPEALPGGDRPAAEGWEPAFLKTLPQPPDLPRSLFQPEPVPAPPPPNLEQYCERDPLLDPPQFRQQPGWFTNVRLDVIHPHLFWGQMKSAFTVKSTGQFVDVAPGAARLNWTVAPRIEAGYRFASGLGGFAFSDRFFFAEGSGPFNGPVGMTNRTSHLNTNYADWDYISREFTPWVTDKSNWTLEWRAGVRLANSWTDVLVDKPFAQAAATNGVFIQGTNNYTIGAGPHFGAQVERLDPRTGLTFVARVDIADTFSRLRQMFAASTTILSTSGVPVRGAYGQNFWNQIAILNYQVGLGWKPPQYPNISLFAGYVYEYWFQAASNMTFVNPHTTIQGASRGAFDNQGIALQIGVNY